MFVVLVFSSFQSASLAPEAATISTGTGAGAFVLSNAYRMVLHPVPTIDSGPWAITVDSHGLVWFLEQTGDKLGSYDPATGTFTEYPIPTPRSTPISAATDAPGNVWFTELSSDKLAELPKGGSSIVERSVPKLPITLGTFSQKLSCGPGAIAVDPAGPIWFACLFSNQIDEYFPGNKTFATFDLPVFPSGPAGLLLDGHGNLWFTAADADMLGKAVLSQLRNGTTNGIAEFAPLNQTYIFQFSQPSLQGGTTTFVSSLPTPSGIAIDRTGRLWVTEHTDSSFDSYAPASGSLVRYWTSQTYGAYGFSATFPNGIEAGKNGIVWVAEHYGNRVAEFDPASGQLTEYAASCCSSSYSGVYNLALTKDGTPWFVEIQGNAIGELVPANDSSPIIVSLPTSGSMGSHGTIAVPIYFSEMGSSGGTAHLSLNISGISNTGVLRNMTALFSPSSVDVGGGHRSLSNLTLSTNNLKPGVYYLTFTATAAAKNVLYSVIFRLTVTAASQNWLPEALAGSAIVFAAATAYLLWGRLKGRPR
jgi:streptogramin lyase